MSHAGLGLLCWTTCPPGAAGVTEVLVSVTRLPQIHVPLRHTWDQLRAAADTLGVPGCCLQRWISPVRNRVGAWQGERSWAGIGGWEQSGIRGGGCCHGRGQPRAGSRMARGGKQGQRCWEPLLPWLTAPRPSQGLWAAGGHSEAGAGGGVVSPPALCAEGGGVPAHTGRRGEVSPECCAVTSGEKHPGMAA